MQRKLAARLAASVLRLPPSPIRPSERQLRKNRAALIRRVYEVDPLVCPRGATMRIVAVITERSVITKILAHLAKLAAASATEGAGPGEPRPPPRSTRRNE